MSQILQGAPKGTTPTGQVTATAVDGNHTGVDVNIVGGGGSGGTASNFGAAIPATGTAIGFSDGTNMQAARVFDTDTGGGTEETLGVVLRKSASGGSVELGTSTNPLRTDPTGGTAQPVSASALPLPTGAATETTLGGVLTTVDFDAKTGSVTETAPATDTASSGLNGRLQRIAQRLSSLIALFPTALSNGFFKVSVQEGIRLPVTLQNSSATEIGTDANPVSVQQAHLTAANDTVAATQSGTWTVQPGNTANTTAWKVDGSAVTQPASLANGPAATGKTLKTAAISLSATGTVVSLVSAKRIKVYAVKLVCDAALSVNWRDGASTALEGAQAIAANGGYVETVSPPAFLFATTAGNSLDLVITGTGNARGRLTYWDDDAT